jgi:hypothetical protein
MQPILHSFNYCLDYVRDLVADLDASNMSARKAGIANHSSWIVGHLTHSCQELGRVIGLDPWLPADWAARYGTGSVPRSDADAYEPKHAALEMLRDSQTRLSEAVARLSEEDLDRPFPTESYREIFPTVRHALTQVMLSHTAYHVGQLATWRKAMGLPPIGRSFE